MNAGVPRCSTYLLIEKAYRSRKQRRPLIRVQKYQFLLILLQTYE